MIARKGITPVIAIVLLLMMTVAAAGMAYVWVTGVQQETQNAVSESMRERTAQMGGGITIDAVYEDNNVTTVAIRNTGSITFTGPVKVFAGAATCDNAFVNATRSSTTTKCGNGSGGTASRPLIDGLSIRAVPPQGAAISVVCSMRPTADTVDNYCVI